MRAKAPLFLEFPAQVFKHHVPDQRGDQCDGKVCACENVIQCEGQRLAASVADGEFTHQEIRIKEENNECNFNDGPQHGDMASTIGLVRGHGVFIVSRTVGHLRPFGWQQRRNEIDDRKPLDFLSPPS